MTIKKYKILIISCIIIIACAGLYIKKNILPDYRFEQALKEAAKVPDTYWDEKYQNMEIKDKYRVVIITTNGGEFTYSKYFQYAAERLGWEVQIYYLQTLGHEKEILSFDPDFIIFSHSSNPSLDMEIKAHRSKKYLLSLASFQVFRDFWSTISKKDPYKATGDLLKFLTLSDGILTAAHEVDIYREILKRLHKEFNGFRMLPLLPQNTYEPAEPKNIMWTGMGTDKHRSSSRYINFIKKLSKDDILKVYGPYLAYSELKPNSYDGYITPGMDNLKAIRRNGIYLLTHSNTHFLGGEPSMRLFEAVSANAVIISDKHPFVIENFGDNFLYFDHDADEETMYKQVKAHYDWIKANPEKAKSMAVRAHKIFLEKFTMEKDLARIAKMHEYILEQERKMNLSFPLAY